MSVAASEHGPVSTGHLSHLAGGTLFDLRRGVVSRRASLTGSDASALDDNRPMNKRAISRRGSVSGMTLPPTTQSHQVQKLLSSSRGTRAVVKSVSSKQEKSIHHETKSNEKKGRGRSQSVQRSSKSTDKSKSSEKKSPKRSFEKKGSGRTSKSSDFPPETKTSEKKGRGRSQSAHRSKKSFGNPESKSSDKLTSAVPPETQAPDKKARGRSISTQRRASKTTKEQARRTYGFNKFETDHVTKREAEAAEKEAAGSALGRRRARSQSVSHRRPSLAGLGKAPSTPEAGIPSTPEVKPQSLAANSYILTEKSNVNCKEVSTFGTASHPGGFPTTWDGNKDSSGAGKTLDPADFPAPAAWDDDPWADEEEYFNPKAPTVTTKVEMTPTVPAAPNNLFRSEHTALGSTSSHSRGSGSSDLGLGSAHSRVSGGRRRSSLTLSTHMDTSFGGKASDAGSVSGRSHIIRRSHSSQEGPTTSTGQRAPPPTAAALFAEKLEAAKRLDQARVASQRLRKADSGRDANSGQVLVADSAEKLEVTKKLDGLDLGIIKRKHSSPRQPTTASAFAAKLQAAMHDDSMSVSDTVNTEPTASVSSSSTRRSSMSSGSSSSKLPRRQSTEMAHYSRSPRPENTAKKTDAIRSGRKQLRRGSSMV
jgi:hypothetical protein